MSNKDARSKADVLQGTLGRRQLARELRAWDRMAGIIHTMLHSEA